MASGLDYKSFELEKAAAPGVGRSTSTLGFLAKAIPIGGAIAFAGYLLYSALPKPPVSPIKSSQEEFHAGAFPAPGLSSARPQLDNGKVYIPPAPTPTPEAVVPPPPVAPPAMIPAVASEAPPPAPAPPMAVVQDDSEARRLAELERQRLAEEETRKWDRLKAPQVVADSGVSGSADSAKAGGSPASATAEHEDDPNKRFLASAGSAGVDVSKADRIERPDALVVAGTMIRATLITAIQSDLPGQVKAVTAEDVYSLDGRRVLIAKGSQVLGEYKSGLSQGQTRVFIVWTRVIGNGDGATYSVQLGSEGTDPLGRAGLTGYLDNHYVERFGSAILLSIVGGGAQYLSSLGSSTSPTVSVTGASGTTTVADARQIAAQQTSQSLTNIAQQALQNSINIPPTVYIDQGTKINIFVKRDLDFSYLYADPVKEALRELKRERSSTTTSSLSR